MIGPAIYDDVYANASVQFSNSLQGKCAKIGQSICQDYLKKNVVVFMTGHRCKGMLGVITDAPRDGRQIDNDNDDLKTLLCRKRIHPDVTTDKGIHCDNEFCEMLFDLLKELGISKQVQNIVTNNAANFSKAFSLFHPNDD